MVFTMGITGNGFKKLFLDKKKTASIAAFLGEGIFLLWGIAKNIMYWGVLRVL